MTMILVSLEICVRILVNLIWLQDLNVCTMQIKLFGVIFLEKNLQYAILAILTFSDYLFKRMRLA